VARNEGVVITFVPYKHRSGGNAVRVSVNPDKEGAVGKYSLKEVAEIYEQLEQIYEKQNKLNTGYFLGKTFLYDF
jgi:predicted acetyltransferase